MLPRHPKARSSDGHAGLWFDKFCDRWRVQDTSWSMKSRKGDDEDNPKLEWINTLTGSPVGTVRQIDEYALRLTRLVERRGGRFFVFITESRFVTGLGRSHPVENGFTWHPTLGTPYLPGSSIKGLVRAWAKVGADPQPACETRRAVARRSRRSGARLLPGRRPHRPRAARSRRNDAPTTPVGPRRIRRATGALPPPSPS